MFSIANFNDPFYILFYTSLITLFFYLLIHLSIAGFLDIRNLSKNIFDKQKYEEVSDYFIYELENRENKINSLVNIIENIKNIENPQDTKVKSHGLHKKIAA